MGMVDAHCCGLEMFQTMLFINAPGGTGKTFVLNTILANLRGDVRAVFATSSSGISSTLLAGGRTIHSTFKVPLDTVNKEFPVCSIPKGSNLANFLKVVSAIIFDECTVPHSSVFEAIDRTFRDLRDCQTEFGRIPVLFCGDYRQILLLKMQDGHKLSIQL